MPASKSNPFVFIPKPDFSQSKSPAATPKTPADEGIEFFQSALQPGDSPIRVYDLRLDSDGGPNKDASVQSPFFALDANL
jgi:glycogen debranching enzyme